MEEEGEGDMGAKAVAEGVAAVAWAISSSEFASIVSSASSTTTSSSSPTTTTTTSSSLSQPLPATAVVQKAKTKKQRKKEKRKEKEREKAAEKEKDKDEREKEKEKEATTGLRTAIKRALVEGYDKLSENAAAAAAATTNGRTSRLRTHSERAASSPPSQSHSSAESSPSRGAAAEQSTGAGAASERRLPSGERERSVTSPPSGSGRKAARKASKSQRSPLGRSEGGSDSSSDDEPFSDRGRERAATVTDDLRTGSVILESPRRYHPELALSPRSQSGRDLTSGTQIGGPRHLSVSHKKPTRIPGEKGSKVLRLQCPQGMSCTSSDADHFLKFQHTPLTQRTSLLRKRSAENPSVPEVKPACPDGEKCTNAKPSHFLQYDHVPADPPASSSSAPTSPSISITSSSSTPSPSSSPTSPSFLEKKVFFEKLGMKSRTMRSWRGKEKKKKDKEEKGKLKNDDDLTQRRICALGDECTSTDPHHFLTHQHTILNLDEKVQWINYNNTHSSSIHVSGVSANEVVDEELELLTQAKQSSRAATADAEEKENEDEDEERQKKEDEEREEAKREETKEEVRRQKSESEAKKAEATHEDKPKEKAKDEPPAFSADVSSPQVQITVEQPVPATTEAVVEPVVPKLGLGLVPPPVPPKPVQLSPRRPMPAGTTHHVQIAEGPDPPAQSSDLKRLVKAASRHILSREFRTSQLRMNKNSDNLLRRKVESEKRESVVREIVTTERNYIRILQAVLDLYQGPLEAKARAKKKWITEDQVKAIFYQIKVIHGLNSTLLQELEERTDERTWNENSAIGDIFVRMSSFLRVYASYNANYAKALLTIKQCKQQKKFNEFLEAVGKGNEKRKQFVGSDLQSFLITPVQRIPRYIILLKMLREHTMDDHVDFAFINEALEKIQTVATENEKIHETSIQLLYLFQVQKKFVQANELGLVESHRRLIAEAEVVLHKYKIEGGGGGGGTKGHASVDQPIAEPVRTIGNPHKAHVRKVFIFNDIIIVAKEAVSGKRGTKAEKKRNERKERERERERERAERAGGVALVDDDEEGKWRFMYQLDVETCQVDALEDSFDFISSRYTQKNAIRLSDSASGRVVRFTMASSEEKQKLLDQLQNVIASFVRSLSSSTASGATKSPQQNQRSSSYIIPAPGSGGSGAHGLIHSSSSNATQPLSSSPSPSSPIAS